MTTPPKANASISLRARLLNLSLLALVTFALGLAGYTLARMHELGGLAYVRPWCTVLACSVVAVGGVAALRNRTWGLLLLLLSSASFAAAWAFGIAPPFFGLMTLGGFAALGLAAPPLARRDPTALLALVFVTVTLGVAAAALAGPGLELAEALMLPT